MSVPDFRTVTVQELARRVRDHELSASEVTEAALARIDELNPVLNAFVAVDAEAAHAQAAVIDARLAAGQEVGHLAGIPIGVKDLENAEGFVTTRGSFVTGGTGPATADSTEVARLRAAGCVVLGKTNTPEDGWTGDTYNPVFGATVNPWNTERSPGGSSGGSSAAIASGMVPLATGSDGGGSIRIPSALTGMSGHKPSQGRVPGGPSPMGASDLSTVGPMARRIRDVALALDVVAGPHAGDLRSLDAPTRSYREALAEPHAPKRVLWAPSVEGQEPDGEIHTICRAAVDRIADAGVEVVETGPVFDDLMGPFALLFFGGMVPGFRAAIEDPDVMARVTPGLQGIIGYANELLTPDSVEEARKSSQRLSLALAARMAGFDALLSPTVAGQTPVSERQGTIDGEESDAWISYTYGFNVTRRPAGTTNAGFTADGMPVGLQIVGHQNDDLGTLITTAWVEDLLGFDPIAPM